MYNLFFYLLSLYDVVLGTLWILIWFLLVSWASFYLSFHFRLLDHCSSLPNISHVNTGCVPVYCCSVTSKSQQTFTIWLSSIYYTYYHWLSYISDHEKYKKKSRMNEPCNSFAFNLIFLISFFYHKMFVSFEEIGSERHATRVNSRLHELVRLRFDSSNFGGQSKRKRSCEFRNAICDCAVVRWKRHECHRKWDVVPIVQFPFQN